ncbi:MAG: aspartate aminotransferase family protein [Planctomycetes bacterium]|nr:aspartate aminotransferase family protein [Planctomycetota bacterium]
MKPKDVPKVDTPFRRIATQIPVPESIPVLEKLRTYEPVSMSGQPLVVWDRAEGFQIHDKWGNIWLDWSSGVLVTNCGHGRDEVREAISSQVDHGLLHSYCFANEPRALLAEKLVSVSPDPLDKVFILTTGSEATENAVKLARTHGIKTGGRSKIGIVTFENAFHGRTLGAQQAGGIPALKEWIVNLDPAFYQVPFPDGFRCEDRSFSLFEKSLAEQGADPDSVAGVMTETYQGGGASFAPPEYIQALAEWCKRHGALLIMDEVQAGFGRTGKMFGFEHYGIVPDLVCCGKGISSSLPVSAVIGRSEIMNQYGPGEMTSTHTGNPVCAMAALANIKLIEKEGLAENARKMGQVLHKGLGEIAEKHSDIIGACHGLGLVAGLHMVKPGGKDPDGDLAFRIIERSVEKGLLFFAPVGFGGATVKIAPPLTITEEAVWDGVHALSEAIEEVRP